ncbi:MAG TPA: hypothetical protein VIK78_17375 [Ruminiclostridium sp.]
MNERGFSKLYWGFLFIMLDFKIQGVDILPDIIGYILFAVGLSMLAGNSMNFKKAGNFNIPMIIISIFSIYEKPAQGGGIQFGPFGILGIPITIAILVLSLLVVYYIFMGIKDMAQIQGQSDIYEEADNRWRQFLLLQLAILPAFILIFIPPLAIIYIIVMLIVSIVMTIIIMQFMRKCGESLGRIGG